MATMPTATSWYRALQAEGIDCQGVERVAGESSGVALIVVDDSSQNAIVIVAGGKRPPVPGRAGAPRTLCWSRRRWWSASWKARWRRLAMCCRAHALGKTVILNSGARPPATIAGGLAAAGGLPGPQQDRKRTALPPAGGLPGERRTCRQAPARKWAPAG
ncbi:hypothetical protein N5K55_09860 [Pseudomonas aeruginosa]|nr:hypothetical protein [Pseudomonas aeruginosa]